MKLHQLENLSRKLIFTYIKAININTSTHTYKLTQTDTRIHEYTHTHTLVSIGVLCRCKYFRIEAMCRRNLARHVMRNDYVKRKVIS